MFFFFKQKTAYEMRISDWSSDVCSSDLAGRRQRRRDPHPRHRQRHERGGAAAHLRAVLHDQAGWQGDRPGPVDRVPHHRGPRRQHRSTLDAWQGQCVYHPPAAAPDARARHRIRTRRRGARRSGRRLNRLTKRSCLMTEVPSSKARVLFVDDEPRVLTTMRILFRARYELFFAESGAAALELLKTQPIDVIVSDQRMPGMTGIELLRTARELNPNAMRILLTGYSDLNAIIGSINEGEIFRFINKPWSNDDLTTTVARAVSAARATQAAEAKQNGRAEERRGGKECVSTCKSRWSPYH